MADPRSPATGRSGADGPDGAATAAPGAGETERLQAEIEQAREQLGETVAALGDKLDVKSRASAGIHDARDRASAGIHDAVYDERGDMRPVVPAVGAGVLLLVGLLVWRRRRS